MAAPRYVRNFSWCVEKIFHAQRTREEMQFYAVFVLFFFYLLLPWGDFLS